MSGERYHHQHLTKPPREGDRARPSQTPAPLPPRRFAGVERPAPNPAVSAAGNRFEMLRNPYRMMVTLRQFVSEQAPI